MTRRILPNRRRSETFELEHGKQATTYRVTVGFAPDEAQPSEIFITGAKTGSDFEAVARDGAIILSIMLQHGIALEPIRHSLTRDENGNAGSIIGAVVDHLTSAAG